MSRFMKNWVVGIFTLTLILTVVTAEAEAFQVHKLEKFYEVWLCLQKYTIRGIYYQPLPDEGKPLLVLVHGATYGKWMWEVPGYSWADYFVAQHGYPVLAIDCLGYGESSHPNGDILIPRLQVHSLKQFLLQIRQEDSQRQIIWIGHSFGALLGNMIAGESCGFLDGLITIGWIHGQETEVGPPLEEYLAQGDYVTWTDEERTTAMYYLDGADLDIIDYDNTYAYPMHRGSLLAAFDPDCFVIKLINVPVLLVAGEYDALWVDIDLEAEATLFEKATVTTFLQSDAGHTCMLHQTYQTLLDAAHDWLEVEFAE